MAGNINCSMHGESQRTYLCEHLTGDSHGLGFNSDISTDENPFPDAWCNDCEVIRAAHGAWNAESEKLCSIKLLCSRCYERVRIRNTITSLSFDDLANLRWKCGGCEEWHTGPCLDFT